LLKQEKDTTPVAHRKYKAGLAMSRPKITPQQLQEIREFAAQWGKIVARRAFGESGPGLDVDFQAMEAVVAAATAGLTEGTFTTLLEQQTQALSPEHPCPDCQQLCPVKREDRPLDVPGGQLTYHEPICHCPVCRRDFFPPTDRAAPGRPQLQPDDAVQDR
jgi:hypothetical protein